MLLEKKKTLSNVLIFDIFQKYVSFLQKDIDIYLHFQLIIYHNYHIFYFTHKKSQ